MNNPTILSEQQKTTMINSALFSALGSMVIMGTIDQCDGVSNFASGQEVTYPVLHQSIMARLQNKIRASSPKQ